MLCDIVQAFRKRGMELAGSHGTPGPGRPWLARVPVDLFGDSR